MDKSDHEARGLYDTAKPKVPTSWAAAEKGGISILVSQNLQLSLPSIPPNRPYQLGTLRIPRKTNRFSGGSLPASLATWQPALASPRERQVCMASTENMAQ